MEGRRIIGLDLGIASEHTARVLDEQGRIVAKRKAVPTVESLTTLEQAALAGAPPGTRIEVVMEPTGPAWLPIAVFFTSRGSRVSDVMGEGGATCVVTFSQRESNTIDAKHGQTAIVDPGGLRLLKLDGDDEAALDGGCGPVTASPSRPASTRSASRTWWAAPSHDPADRGTRNGRPGGPRALGRPP